MDSSSPAPDERTRELVVRAQSGELDAFNALFARYQERVEGVVRKRLGAKLRRKVETADVAQLAFAKAFEKFDSFSMENENALINWLASIIENQIRDQADHFGAQKRDSGGAVSLDHDQEWGGAPPVADRTGDRPAEQADLGEQRERLRAALETLDEEWRMVIHLRDFEKRSWQEVADALGHPSAEAVRQRYRKAKVKLVEILSRDDEAD